MKIVCSPAMFGDDPTTFFVLRDEKGTDRRPWRPPGRPSHLETVATACIALAAVFENAEILVDEAGFGGSVVDMLRMRGAAVKALPYDLRDRLRGSV